MGAACQILITRPLILSGACLVVEARNSTFGLRPWPWCALVVDARRVGELCRLPAWRGVRGCSAAPSRAQLRRDPAGLSRAPTTEPVKSNSQLAAATFHCTAARRECKSAMPPALRPSAASAARGTTLPLPFRSVAAASRETGQGSKFRSIFGEISVFFLFSLDTGNRNFGRFRDFSFRNLKIQKKL